MEPPHRIPVIHCVESRDLVHAHRRHLQDARHLIHDADTREAVLPLPEIEQGHHGGFFVLQRVAFEDLGDEFLVQGGEAEGYGGVVLGAVAMLRAGGPGTLVMKGNSVLGEGERLDGKTYDLKGLACHSGSGGEGTPLGLDD